MSLTYMLSLALSCVHALSSLYQQITSIFLDNHFLQAKNKTFFFVFFASHAAVCNHFCPSSKQEDTAFSGPLQYAVSLKSQDSQRSALKKL